ncbi:uncharacterized protein LOC131162574 [Malania oleifera]|uniref:uncharacterized protein LOC131162574 n=1 Tax=Malania oleifera TaxID=397392 RepID=UPI0025AE4959|nr:uncharacterized protein LOC131162574 [Malania oleifera]
MSANGHCFVEWKEEFISQERGNRVVHYFLKDSAGDSTLAVVGTERSVRHMFYVVADDFLKACGPENSVHAGFKWRSRREVVDWLTSMLSKQHLPRDLSKLPKNDTTHALGSCNLPPSARRTSIPDYLGRLARDLKGHDSDIVWSGIAWTCGKQLKHYPAFCRNRTTIAIQSFVFVMAKDEDHYLAYLEDMYEDRKGQKKVKVRWFHYNQEVKGVVPLRNSHPKEVFITPYSQVISAECVDGPATVLTPEHYEKCLAASSQASLARIHLCFRQFRNNKVKPFDLSKLRGYFDQAILTCLDPNPISHDLAGEEDEEFSIGENVKLGGKRTRSCRARQRFVAEQTGARLFERKGQVMTHEPAFKNLKYGLSGKRLISIKPVEPRPWHMPPFKVDDKIEFLCQDSGIRGCWFRCTVLQVSRKQMKLQYDDLPDEDGCGNLEEWIPACRLAMPDKLGMRCLGRPTVRPFPPNDQMDHAFDVGSPVDAWWSDGWWEGVVAGVGNCKDNSVQVFFPGEKFFLNIHTKNLRISRDWVGDQWVKIEAKPDISLAISAIISPDTKLSTSSAVAKDAKFEGFSSPCPKVLNSTKVDTIEEEKLDLTASDAKFDDFPVSFRKASVSTQPKAVEEKKKLSSAALTSTNALLEEGDLVNDEKQQSTRDEGNLHNRDPVGDSHGEDKNNIDDAHDDDTNNIDGGSGDGGDNSGEKLEYEATAQNHEAVELMEVVA